MPNAAGSRNLTLRTAPSVSCRAARAVVCAIFTSFAALPSTFRFCIQQAHKHPDSVSPHTIL